MIAQIVRTDTKILSECSIKIKKNEQSKKHIVSRQIKLKNVVSKLTCSAHYTFTNVLGYRWGWLIRTIFCFLNDRFNDHGVNSERKYKWVWD